MNDFSGTNNGVLLGGATASAAGFNGNAITFDGTNSYVQIPDSPSLRPTNLTVEAWIRFTALDSAPSGSTPAGLQYIIFKQNTRTSYFEGYSLFKTRVSGSDYFAFNVTGASGVQAEIRSTTAIAAGVWYHVVAMRGPTTIQLYINGVLQAQMNVAFAQDYGNFPLYFGSTGQSYWDRKFRGQLDEATLYNRALSAAEVTALFNAGAAGKCKGPAITGQPQSTTVAVGSNVVLSVTATGSPSPSYQWQRSGTNLVDGGNISGSTGPALSISNIQSEDAATYRVLVSNTGGSTTSAVATVTVLIPPAIAQDPANVTSDAGTTIGFTAAATGSTPLSLLWQRNGSALTDGGRISGATTGTLQISNLQPADAGNYTLLASNAIGTATSATAILTVTGPPTIQTQPTNISAAVGANVSFAVGASGTAPLSYQWRRNGLDVADGAGISGATSNVLVLTGVQTNSSGAFSVVITNTSGSLTSATATLTITLPPNITTQPQSQAVTYGSNVVFSVSATGATPLAYQWRRNGTNLVNGGQISGATSPTLTVSFALAGNAGNYTVFISNAVGTATSDVATLTVLPPTDCVPAPSGLIGWWPGDGNANDIVGTNHGTMFSNATANAVGYVGQAMKFDGTNSYIRIPDAPELRPQNFTVACWVLFTGLNGVGNTPLPGQQYMVFKGNTRTCNNFEAFVLSKDRDPGGDVFLWEVTSASGQLIRSDSKTFLTTNVWYHVVGVCGTGYLEMYVNGVMETNTTFNFPIDYGIGKPLMFGSSGESCYDRKLHALMDEVCLWNRALSSNEVTALYTSGLAGLCKGTNGLLINVQPQPQNVIAGNNASFNVSAAGVAPFSYQWQFNNSNIPGATNSTFIVTNSQLANVGNYRVIITNPAGTKVSADAALSISNPLNITQDPTNQTVIAGGGTQFAVAVSGAGPINYQWYFNNTPVSGGTNALLTLEGVQPSAAGDYAAVVSNSSITLTSAVATLTVLVPPFMVQQPSPQVVLAGGAASFTAVAGGDAPLSYQWQFNGTNISGASLPTLNLSGVQPGQVGGYSVIVSNPVGATNSATAQLTVLTRPVLLNPRNVGEGVFGFTLSGNAGFNYVVEVSTNSLDWTGLTSITNQTGQVEFSDPGSSSNVLRFYRARFAE